MAVPVPTRRFSPDDLRPNAARLNEFIDLINLLAQLVTQRGGELLGGVNVRVVAFKVVEEIDGASGYYRLRLFEGDFSVRPDDGELTEEQLGFLSSSVNAIGVNLTQLVEDGEPIDDDTIHWGMIAGRIDDESAYAGMITVAFAVTPPSAKQTTITITGNHSRGGIYTAHLVDPAGSTLAGSGNLSLSDIGVVVTSVEVLALNGTEIGKSTHALEIGRVCPAQKLRVEDDKLIVLISEVDFFDCNPDA